LPQRRSAAPPGRLSTLVPLKAWGRRSLFLMFLSKNAVAGNVVFGHSCCHGCSGASRIFSATQALPPALCGCQSIRI
jgi:hypothetical protein